MLVLIADDEEPLLDVLSDAVRGFGHNVIRAIDGEQALTLARSHAPDLVITDEMMPRRTGTQLIEALRDDPVLATVPVILMSAVRPKREVTRSTYLPKPIKLAVFEKVIASALAPGSTIADRAPSDADVTSAGLALEEMLRWVAHELKTPLSAALMASQLLQKRLEEIGDDTDRKRTAVVLRALDRMTTLVTHVLDAARLSDGRVRLDRKRRDLAPFLEDVVASWRELCPGVSIVLESESVVLSFDGERVRQIVDNLISNAIKYAPEKPITISVAVSPGLASIRVRDEGPGIEAAELPRIFQRFHRTGAEGAGHGLGLYIASMLARLHGGTLTVRSRLGEGSTFCLALPTAE